MQFLVFMIPGIYQPGKKIDPDFAPNTKDMEKMGQFNDAMGKAVKVLGLNGLKPLNAGARVTYTGGKATVTDGPFIEAKEVVGGYWMLEAKSKEEVVNWMKKCPAGPDDVIEIRPIFDMSDFPTKGSEAVKS